MSLERNNFQETAHPTSEEYYAVRSELSELRIEANLAVLAGEPITDTARIEELSFIARELAESANDIVIQ